MNLEDLAVDHDYYCSESNYYSNNASERYETFPDFYKEFGNADVDMNLVFRWDLRQADDKSYSMEIFIIQQRKGIFKPCLISRFEEKDIELFLKYITPHIEKLKRIWIPLRFEAK